MKSLGDLFLKYTEPIEPIPTDLAPSGCLKNEIKALIFDIYGTLFMSASGDIHTMQRNIKRPSNVQKSLLPALKMFANQVGDIDIQQQFFKIIERKHVNSRKRGVQYPEIDVREIWKEILKCDDRDKIEKFSVIFEAVVNPVYPMPDLKMFLDNLKKQQYLMGIVSNAQFFTPLLFCAFMGEDLDSLGFNPALIVYSYEMGESKPSLKLFEKIRKNLKNYRLSPSQVLYVGNDMLNDIWAAQQLKFQTCLFAGDKRSLRLRSQDSRCVNLKPDIIITELRQLLELI